MTSSTTANSKPTSPTSPRHTSLPENKKSSVKETFEKRAFSEDSPFKNSYSIKNSYVQPLEKDSNKNSNMKNFNSENCTINTKNSISTPSIPLSFPNPSTTATENTTSTTRPVIRISTKQIVDESSSKNIVHPSHESNPSYSPYFSSYPTTGSISIPGQPSSNYSFSSSVPVHPNFPPMTSFGISQHPSNALSSESSISLPPPISQIAAIEIAKSLYYGTNPSVSHIDAASWIGDEGVERAAIRNAYMSLFAFTDTSILLSLRELCQKLYMKAESQQLDRIVDSFSEYWCKCNPNHKFKYTSIVYTIAYSILLLNTDHHSETQSGAKKMQRAQYVNSTLEAVKNLALAEEKQENDDSRNGNNAKKVSSSKSTKNLQGHQTNLSSSSSISSSSSSLLLNNNLSENSSAKNNRLPLKNSGKDSHSKTDNLALVNDDVQHSNKEWESIISALLKYIYASIDITPLVLAPGKVNNNNNTHGDDHNNLPTTTKPHNNNITHLIPGNRHKSVASLTDYEYYNAIANSSYANNRSVDSFDLDYSRNSFDQSVFSSKFTSSKEPHNTQPVIGFAGALMTTILREENEKSNRNASISNNIPRTIPENEEICYDQPEKDGDGNISHFHNNYLEGNFSYRSRQSCSSLSSTQSRPFSPFTTSRPSNSNTSLNSHLEASNPLHSTNSHDQTNHEAHNKSSHGSQLTSPTSSNNNNNKFFDMNNGSRASSLSSEAPSWNSQTSKTLYQETLKNSQRPMHQSPYPNQSQFLDSQTSIATLSSSVTSNKEMSSNRSIVDEFGRNTKGRVGSITGHVYEEELLLHGAPWGKEGLLQVQVYTENGLVKENTANGTLGGLNLNLGSNNKKDWSSVFAVVQQGYLKMFQFDKDSHGSSNVIGSRSNKLKRRGFGGFMRRKSVDESKGTIMVDSNSFKSSSDKSNSKTGNSSKSSKKEIKEEVKQVGSGNWFENATMTDNVSLCHTIAQIVYTGCDGNDVLGILPGKTPAAASSSSPYGLKSRWHGSTNTLHLSHSNNSSDFGKGLPNSLQPLSAKPDQKLNDGKTWALILPNKTKLVFLAGTKEIADEFVYSCNYWAARVSKEPLVEAVTSNEFGWEKPISLLFNSVTPESPSPEVLSPIITSTSPTSPFSPSSATSLSPVSAPTSPLLRLKNTMNHSLLSRSSTQSSSKSTPLVKRQLSNDLNQLTYSRSCNSANGRTTLRRQGAIFDLKEHRPTRSASLTYNRAPPISSPVLGDGISSSVSSPINGPSPSFISSPLIGPNYFNSPVMISPTAVMTSPTIPVSPVMLSSPIVSRVTTRSTNSSMGEQIQEVRSKDSSLSSSRSKSEKASSVSSSEEKHSPTSSTHSLFSSVSSGSSSNPSFYSSHSSFSNKGSGSPNLNQFPPPIKSMIIRSSASSVSSIPGSQSQEPAANLKKNSNEQQDLNCQFRSMIAVAVQEFLISLNLRDAAETVFSTSPPTTPDSLEFSKMSIQDSATNQTRPNNTSSHSNDKIIAISGSNNSMEESLPARGSNLGMSGRTHVIGGDGNNKYREVWGSKNQSSFPSLSLSSKSKLGNNGNVYSETVSATQASKMATAAFGKYLTTKRVPLDKYPCVQKKSFQDKMKLIITHHTPNGVVVEYDGATKYLMCASELVFTPSNSSSLVSTTSTSQGSSDSMFLNNQKVSVAKWQEPLASPVKSTTLDEYTQSITFMRHVKSVEESYEKHIELRALMNCIYNNNNSSTSTANKDNGNSKNLESKSIHGSDSSSKINFPVIPRIYENWEQRANYLLREMMKYEIYTTTLKMAIADKEALTG